MECAGYGNPCIVTKDSLNLSGDLETLEIKQLFELCFETYPDQPIKKNLIVDLVKNQDDLFSYYDFDKRGDQTKFSLRLRKYIGREFSNIVLNIFNQDQPTARQEYIFKKCVNPVNPVNLSPIVTYGTNNINNGVVKVTKDNKGSQGSKLDSFTKKKSQLDQFTPEEIKKSGFTKEQLADMLKEEKA